MANFAKAEMAMLLSAFEAAHPEATSCMAMIGKKNAEIYARVCWEEFGIMPIPLPLDRAVAVIKGRI